eukprot:TRINITY_DN2296_c0_g1_i1.p1 TRINITY_DN2296_c0_g1~~TRINITY_DN2296_c0_g1_i1.p1  ORF type:complete len:211 (+),score=51.04 TRINITY_DN2296_c0_g1_i1:930-1562(+)
MHQRCFPFILRTTITHNTQIRCTCMNGPGPTNRPSQKDYESCFQKIKKKATPPITPKPKNVLAYVAPLYEHVDSSSSPTHSSSSSTSGPSSSTSDSSSSSSSSSSPSSSSPSSSSPSSSSPSSGSPSTTTTDDITPETATQLITKYFQGEPKLARDSYAHNFGTLKMTSQEHEVAIRRVYKELENPVITEMIADLDLRRLFVLTLRVIQK